MAGSINIVKLYIGEETSSTPSYDKGYAFSTARLFSSLVEESETKKEEKINSSTNVKYHEWDYIETYNSYKLTLTKLNYHKQMYKPCFIYAEFELDEWKVVTQTWHCTASLDEHGEEGQVQKSENPTVSTAVGTRMSSNEAINSFKGKNVSLRYEKYNITEEKDDNGKTVTDENGNIKYQHIYSADGSAEIAKNYLVYKVNTLKKKDSSSLFVKLTIYSEDKLLTLEKYSKAWTAKRLGKDIFNKEIGNYKLSSTPSPDLQILSYGNDTGENEFRIPYLVQYNETFYDFLRRTTNRCGEFLYFEDGQLHLGVTMNRKDKTLFDSNNNQITPTDYSTVAQEFYHDGLYNDGVFEGERVVDDYAYNYLKNTSSSSSKNPANSSNYHYNDPLAQDDYLGDIGKKYTDWDTQWGAFDKNSMSVLMNALSGKSLSDIVATFVANEVFKTTQVGAVVGTLNNTHKEMNIESWEGNDCKDQWNGDKLRQFGTAVDQLSQISSGVVNMNAQFYSLVRKAEKKVGEDAVWFHFGESFQDLKLGDVINVEGFSYLVIKVSGGYEYKAKTDSTEASTTASQQVVAIPLFGKAEIPIPEALPNTMVRESQAQLAFVTKDGFFDPKKIGRVRVRFAWQDTDGDATPWIRVSLPFATDGGGVKFKPNANDEVLVNFEEGNVERPYVSGFLLSERSNESWRALPDRGITSKNGHSISFNDPVDGATFYYNLYPGLSLVRSFFPASVWPNTLTDEKGSMALAGSTVISDRYGLYKILCSSDSRQVLIQSAMGNVTLSAFTGITISAPNGDIKIAGKNVTIAANNKVNIMSGTDIKNRFVPDSNVNDDGVSGYFKKFFGSAGKTILNAIDDSLTYTFRKFVDKFLDMSLIRTVLEIVLRPIDGTTKIKSLTFVQIEAGKGSVEFPVDAISKKHQREAYYPRLKHSLDLITEVVNHRIDDVKQKYNIFYQNLSDFKAISGENEDKLNRNYTAISFDTIKTKGWTNRKEELADSDFRWADAGLDDEVFDKDAALNNVKEATGLQQEPKPEDECYQPNGNRQGLYDDDHDAWNAAYKNLYTDVENGILVNNTIKGSDRDILFFLSNNLAKALKDLHDAIDNLNITKDNISIKSSDVYKDTVIESMGNLQNVVTDDWMVSLANGTGITVNSNNGTGWAWEDAKKKARRTSAHALLTKVAARWYTWTDRSFFLQAPKAIEATNVLDNDAWNALFAECVKEKPAPEAPQANPLKDEWRRFKSNNKQWWDSSYKEPWRDMTVNRHRWATGVQGKILLSDSPTTTISFNNQGTPEAPQWNFVASPKYAKQLIDYLKNL